MNDRICVRVSFRIKIEETIVKSRLFVMTFSKTENV